MGVKINGYVLCGTCRREHLISKLTNLLNKLNNRSDLTVKITNLSNELLETLKKIENCTSCKDNIRKYYSRLIYNSINKIEKHLILIEKEEGEQKGKKDIIYKLNDELVEIDSQLNRYILCEACGKEHLISKLSNLLNKLNNRSDLTVKITNLSNELLEKLKAIENCINCKNRKIGRYDLVDLYESIS